MRIGIDISQIAHEKTGVAIYVKNLVENLAKHDTKNTYILFYASLRKDPPHLQLPSNFKIHRYKIPPTLLDVIWNRLHILPIERLIGDIDIFISSDWTQPPTKAKSITILYDLIVYTYPDETDKKIVATQKRRLAWVRKECDQVLCISESTKEDAQTILKIPEKKLTVVYPGI